MAVMVCWEFGHVWFVENLGTPGDKIAISMEQDGKSLGILDFGAPDSWKNTAFSRVFPDITYFV